MHPIISSGGFNSLMLIAIKASTTTTLLNAAIAVTGTPIPDTSLGSEQLAQPNTTIHYPVYTTHDEPMPTGQLKGEGCRRLTT